MDKFEEERRETEQLLRSICHYPYKSGSWSKEGRLKARLLEHKGAHDGSAGSEPDGTPAAARSRGGRLVQTAPASLQMHPDEAGLLTFEIVASTYELPAGEYEIPLSGSLPLTVDAGGKSILSLSTAPAASIAGPGGVTIKPPGKGVAGSRGRPPHAGRR